MNTYSEILKIWNSETPDDFAIFSDFYYQMFGEDFNIPYETDSTKSSFFPYDWFIMSTDFPIYKKQLPQVWLEDDKFVIESDSFRYVIADDLKLLFKLCRRFKSDAIAQTYTTNWWFWLTK